MQYRLEYTEEARAALRTAPGFYRQRFRRAIEGLASNPRPPEAKPTRDHDRYKIYFDRWRLIYTIHEADGAVRILRIAKKTGPETYQGLEDAEDAADAAAARREPGSNIDFEDYAARRGKK